ncbi:MAG: hypothetical protein H2050_07095 [Sphingobium sp.]|uniref:hypothetical protein n=1 Tax=Sphingobium sp. TaxID=1912891 RepID=UPI001796EA05|nr:hypothetical protein [Sphingobium sp.]MBA4754579.1 hypothetical protein [Sphingobium sp.]
MTQRSNVLPSAIPMTVEDAREILAKPLLALCSENGPSAVARAIGGCEDKTVRDARDEKSTLRLDLAANLLLLDGTAFDGFLARVGRRSVPMEATCSTDALPAMTGAVHKLVMATSGNSVDGPGLSRCELFDSEADLRQAFDAIGALLGRIDRLKAGLAA